MPMSWHLIRSFSLSNVRVIARTRWDSVFFSKKIKRDGKWSMDQVCDPVSRVKWGGRGEEWIFWLFIQIMSRLGYGWEGEKREKDLFLVFVLSLCDGLWGLVLKRVRTFLCKWSADTPGRVCCGSNHRPMREGQKRETTLRFPSDERGACLSQLTTTTTSRRKRKTQFHTEQKRRKWWWRLR